MTKTQASAAAVEVFDEETRFIGTLYGASRARMVCVGLGPGELLVVTPGAPMNDELWPELERWGKPRFLLAPNHFHNAGLATWQARYPEAKVVAHPDAVPRLRKQVKGVTFHGLDELVAALPEGVRLFGPPMAKQGETWVGVTTKRGKAWFVTDAILNERRLPGGVPGIVMRVVGFRKGLHTNPFFKRFFLRDKRAYKAWVAEELERDQPVLFVPAHGAPLHGAEVKERLRAVTETA